VGPPERSTEGHRVRDQGDDMTTKFRGTAQLGDLVVAAFDKAARYSNDPREVSRLATWVVEHMLRRARRTLTPPSPKSWRDQNGGESRRA